MNPQTVKKLNQLNYSFYESAGQIWNPNPNYYWQGWYKLVNSLELKVKSASQTSGDTLNATSSREACEPSLSINTPLKILDLGCGNARFAGFLKENFPNTSFNYIGLDNSDYLLDAAKTEPKSEKFDVNIYKADLVFDNWETRFKDEKFDVIVAFGLLHHIPGYENRLNILTRAKNLLSKNGLLIFTFWQYLDVQRLRKRVVSSQKRKEILEELEINGGELEEGDNFLDWVKLVESIRFSHYFHPQERQKLLQDLDMKLLKEFEEDGRTENVNRYWVLGNRRDILN